MKIKLKKPRSSEEQERLEKSAHWYNSRKSFDYYLIKFGSETILKRARGPRVLELGCGSGVMTEELVKHFPEVVVVEGAQHYIKEAFRRVRSNKVTYIRSLFEEFTPRGRFNSIIMASILEHIDDPVGLLKRTATWLTPKGTLHIIVPNAESLHRRIGKAMGIIKELDELQEHDYRIGHRRYYSIKSIIKDINQAGLKIVVKEGLCLKPLPNEQMQKLSEKLIRAFFIVGKELPDYCSQLYLMLKNK
jgi:2-polyprenyl-3-methyl-5-hydroxy-6-metoxy-1,4-benzoquinol methylase